MNWRCLFLSLVICSFHLAALAAQDTSAVKVEIVESGSGFQLLRDGTPYEIRGAGLEYGDISSLALHGGNAIRNWTTDDALQVLDTAHAHGVTVALCLPMQPERHGFDYSDPEAVAEQLSLMREEVLKYKDHPALLAWIIGNELNFDYSNSAVYDAVNDVSKMIHELDPNHPTTTTVAGIGEDVLSDLESRASDLDFLSFQVYGEVFNLQNFLRYNEFERPVWITEWGAIGHWEMESTDWGAPIEMTSTEKANVYQRAFDEVLTPLEGKVIGTFAFLWGQKQERTPTWFGMFTELGEETETVDVMHRIWTGQWPTNRSPILETLLLDGKSARQNIELVVSESYQAEVDMLDPDGDDIDYRWEIKTESTSQQVGGDRETPIVNVQSDVSTINSSSVEFAAPDSPGAYRLFVYGFDGNNHAAHANIPFLVTGK
ncbi:MAG: hypothetical protein OXU66_10810 [Gammaproteobacteria bacterium]|nr:hypothetical protein [Gammaproteobacteria bacterium]MDD9959421.1 hypothetical protein [Gammaproteobacteria bacterium]